MFSIRQVSAYMFFALMTAAGISGCVSSAEVDTPELEDGTAEFEDDIPELEDGFEDGLSEKYGCGDVTFYAYDEANEVMLSLRVDGMVIAAFDAGEETTTDFDLPVEEVKLIVEQGRDISSAICNDVIENEGPVVLESYTATSGMAQITVRPGEEDEYDGARGDLRLEDVVFASDEDGETVTLTSLDIQDVSIGWFAG